MTLPNTGLSGGLLGIGMLGLLLLLLGSALTRRGAGERATGRRAVQRLPDLPSPPALFGPPNRQAS